MEVITLWETNVAMENGPFEDVFLLKMGYSIAMLVYQRVTIWLEDHVVGLKHLSTLSLSHDGSMGRLYIYLHEWWILMGSMYIS